MSADKTVDAVLFDIDGTLISTGGAGSAAWRRAFDDLYGVPADIGAFTDAGMTDPEVGRITFKSVVGREPSPEELDEVMAKRQAYLPQTVAESKTYKVLPGVQQLLPRLVREGYRLGLTTGGTEETARIKLERAGLNKYFSFGGYGSDSPDRVELTKRAIERARTAADRTMVVGDTPLDISAARAAGAISVGVASGHYTTQELRAAGGDHVIASLEEGLPL